MNLLEPEPWAFAAVAALAAFAYGWHRRGIVEDEKASAASIDDYNHGFRRGLEDCLRDPEAARAQLAGIEAAKVDAWHREHGACPLADHGRHEYGCPLSYKSGHSDT